MQLRAGLVLLGVLALLWSTGGRLEAAAACPAPRLKATVLPFGDGIGRSPVWAVALDGPDARVSLIYGKTALGYRHKILWLVKSSLPHRVTLTISGRDGRLQYIRISGAKAARAATLDPRDPPIPPGTARIAEFPSVVFFSRPGCYRVRLTWPTGTIVVPLRATKE